MSIPITHFYMIRHGETEANAAQTMAGSLDTPLTTRGREQAHAAKSIIEKLKIKPKTIIHSHLSRARDTAKIINEALDIPIHEDPDWAELCAGDWEGTSYEISKPLFTKWITPPNGEPAKEFFARVKRAKIRALSQKTAPVLIVCHGGVMRAIGQIHGINTPGKFQNAQLYEYTPAKDKNNFPWDVSYYDLCAEKNILIKNPSKLYSGLTEPAIDEIAS